MRTLAAAAVATVFSLSSWAKAATVDAGALTAVTVEAPLYDTRLSANNGCDPAGCVGDLTRDGDLATSDSRWSCQPALGSTGSTCSITYTLGYSLTLEGLNIALYQGDTRTRTIDIYVDGNMFTSWTSSGTTAAFETVDLGVAGKTVELRGVLTDSEWLSVMEVEILVDEDAEPVAVEAGTLGTVTTAAALYDLRLSDDNGCDPAGCTASLTRDGDMDETSRWSCAPSLGGTCTVSYDIGAVRELYQLRLAMYRGTTRRRTVEVYVDDALVTTWTSSGTTDGFESIDLSGVSGEVIEVTGVLANSEWLSIVETEIMVLPDGVTPPSPTPTPGAPVQPTTPTGDLETVGLIPLADGDESDLQRFYTKDGDLSTSWTCTGDPWVEDPTFIDYDCSLEFDMFSYRHIKQVKIALPEGANGAVDLRISARWMSDVLEEFVTSSGTTDGFETYDFDYFTNIVIISPVFASTGETISISEVQFVEEVRTDEVSVSDTSTNTPWSSVTGGVWEESTTDAFEFISDDVRVLDRAITFTLSSYATVTAMEMQFPVGDTYLFDLEIYNDQDDDVPLTTIASLESENTAGWQSFDLESHLAADQYVTEISVVMKGTGSGASGFKMLDARFIGVPIDNPTDNFYVGSTNIENWYSDRYPDLVAEGTGDQHAIMEAICTVKKATFDGVDCVGEDATATGTVHLPMGEFMVDGNIFMKTGVFLTGRFSGDDAPYTTDIQLEEGAGGNTDIDALLVMDGISDARIDDLWIRGLYDPDTSNDSPAVEGLGSMGLSVIGSQNITCIDTEIRFLDGDAMVVRNSNTVNIDAGPYDDLYFPWTIGRSRGTGLVVDSSEHVWVRRHAMWDNGVAGIQITGSNNFTFEATIGDDNTQGEGYVGSLDGQQPIEVIVESSSLVTFQEMKVRSTNDPVMTVSADSSAVSFNNCGFTSVESGTCVIQAEDPSVVTAEDDELTLDGTCFVKV